MKLWPRKKKKSKKLEHEEEKEESLERKAIRLIREARSYFERGVNYCTRLDNEETAVHGMSVISQNRIPELIGDMDNAESALLNVRMFLRKMERLAEDIESKLLVIRISDDRGRSLSDKEKEILGDMKGLEDLIDRIVNDMRDAKSTPFDKILDDGHNRVPLDKNLGLETRAIFVRILNGLAHIETRFQEIFELQREVDRISKKFMEVHN